jgi:hypothetical protein
MLRSCPAYFREFAALTKEISMQIVGWMILLLLIVARPVFAAFEGYIEMNMTMKEGSGTMKGQISSVGTRAEVAARVAQMGDMPVTMTMIMKFSNPDVVYMLNDATKTYVEFNVKDIGDADKNRPDKEYTVKKLGKEKVAGYVCEHLLLTAKDSTETEVWTTKDLVDLNVFREYMRRNRQSADVQGIMKALKEAGAEGFIAKMISRDKTGAPAVTLELVKAEKRTVAASLFEIPAGYKKQEGMLGMMPGMMPISPEQQQTINKAMEKLTPEQRKMLENIMKKRGSGQ